MITFAVLSSLLILLRFLLPDVSSYAIKLILIGFSFPIITFAAGTVIWFIGATVGTSQFGPEDWVRSCAFGGVPCAIVCSFAIRRFLSD